MWAGTSGDIVPLGAKDWLRTITADDIFIRTRAFYTRDRSVCGVSGIMHKNVNPGILAPIGQELIKMLESMKHRGEDSTGVTVAGEKRQGDLILRIWASNGKTHDHLLAEAEGRIAELGGVVVSKSQVKEYLRIVVNFEGDLRHLAKVLLDIDGVEIHSIGKNSEVVKDVGTALVLDRKHDVSSLRGTHGIGHVRLATESRVDISHAHPFWAYPFPDITVVHNGQLTNYHSMKHRYEDTGFRFQTDNDSEIIAVYLADRLARGARLEEALEDSLQDLDGTFTFLVSTSSGMGYAKDRWSAKPLVTMETEEVVAIASEEVALRSIFPQELDRFEPQENAVMTWSI